VPLMFAWPEGKRVGQKIDWSAGRQYNLRLI
jgi:hypothetical protein